MKYLPIILCSPRQGKGVKEIVVIIIPIDYTWVAHSHLSVSSSGVITPQLLGSGWQTARCRYWVDLYPLPRTGKPPTRSDEEKVVPALSGGDQFFRLVREWRAAMPTAFMGLGTPKGDIFKSFPEEGYR
jgi:hypothetical protein